MKYLIAVLVLISQFGFSQGHAIRVKIKGIIPQKTCFLGHYNGFGTVTEVEMSQPDQNGYMIFKGPQPLQQGLYQVRITPTKAFELVIAENQDFSLSTDTLDFYGLTKFISSSENQAFYDYQNKAVKLLLDLKNPNNNSKRNDSIQTAIKQHKDNFLTFNEGMFVTKIIKAGISPEPPKKKSDLYQFYQNHFWDNVDLTDARMLRTPFLPEKIDQYIDQRTYPHVDSLTKASVRLIEAAKGNKEMFRFFLSTLVRKFENPKINGMEGVYVNLVEKYYASKQADWLDSYTLNGIVQKANNMKPLLLGKVFPSLDLQDPAGKLFKISEIEAKYTAVVFYSPTCSHCIATMPKIKQFQDEYASRGVKVLNVTVRETGQVWKDFIAKQEVGHLYHGWSAGKDEGFYYYTYDVAVFPTIYVLDAEKKIIGRKLAGEELGKFIDFTEGK